MCGIGKFLADGIGHFPAEKIFSKSWSFTSSMLQPFVDGAHARGIRVLFDVVMNHPGYETGAPSSLQSTHRVITGRFMAIEQAMGTPKGRAAGARYLRQFVEEMKASGFVARGLERNGQRDATVAPPAR